MSRTLRVRQSQTVVPFGAGAVFDIQGESFVATGIGDGSHVFSATLEEHNAAVKQYLARLRSNRLNARP